MYRKQFDDFSERRISYLLVTRNRADYLAYALERCRALIGPEDELIVVDGASTDHTPAIIEQYHDVVTTFISEPDLNSPHGQNKGILLARGRYIKQISDDDIFHREGMEKAVQVMDQHPEIDMLLCGGTKERNGRVYAYAAPVGVNYGKSPEDVFRYQGATGVGHMVRRSSLAKVWTLFPLTVNADAHYVAAFIARGGVVRFCRINTFHHVIYLHSIIHRERSAHVQDTFTIMKQYCSPWFYWRMRAVHLLKQNWCTGPILRMARRAFFPKKSTRIVWDGGFS